MRRFMEKDVNTIIELLRICSKRLAELFVEEFVGMILFGSWARGEAKPDSDIDILLIFKSLEGLEVRSKAYNIIAEHVKSPITIVDMRLLDITDKEYELTPLMLNILYDGIIVWDKNRVLEEFVRRGRLLIDEMKLIRYRVPDGKYGWKRADGKPIAQSMILSDKIEA